MYATKTEEQSQEDTEKSKSRDILQNTWPVLLKTIKVIEEKIEKLSQTKDN